MDVDYVLFLGRPFLKQLAVTLDYKEETMTFYSLSKSESSRFNLLHTIMLWCGGAVIMVILVAVAIYIFILGRRREERVQKNHLQNWTRPCSVQLLNKEPMIMQ
eukprot:992748_1